MHVRARRVRAARKKRKCTNHGARAIVVGTVKTEIRAKTHICVYGWEGVVCGGVDVKGSAIVTAKGGAKIWICLPYAAPLE